MSPTSGWSSTTRIVGSDEPVLMRALTSANAPVQAYGQKNGRGKSTTGEARPFSENGCRQLGDKFVAWPTAEGLGRVPHTTRRRNDGGYGQAERSVAAAGVVESRLTSVPAAKK